MGFSDRAKDALLAAFAKLAPELNFEFRAVSDIWSRRRKEGVAFAGKLNGKPVDGLRNHDGRTNPDMVRAVLDYGPLNNPAKGFQVLFPARMGNASGRENELFFSNRGTLDLTTTHVSADGGLTNVEAGKAGMQPNMAVEATLVPNAFRPTSAANTGAEVSVLAHMRNWMECIRSRREPVAGVRAGYDHSVAHCMTIAALRSGWRVTFEDAKQEVAMA